jgi:hypothetical protein
MVEDNFDIVHAVYFYLWLRNMTEYLIRYTMHSLYIQKSELTGSVFNIVNMGTVHAKVSLYPWFSSNSY